MAERVGRPSEMSPEAVKKLEEAFALDCSIPEACFYANISKTTYYNWLGKNPQLVDRFEELRNNPVLLARKKVVDDIMGNVDTAKWYLDRRVKDFKPKSDLTSNNKIIPIYGGFSKHDSDQEDIQPEEKD